MQCSSVGFCLCRSSLMPRYLGLFLLAIDQGDDSVAVLQCLQLPVVRNRQARERCDEVVRCLDAGYLCLGRKRIVQISSEFTSASAIADHFMI